MTATHTPSGTTAPPVPAPAVASADTARYADANEPLAAIERSIDRRLAAEGVPVRESWLFERPRLGIRNGSVCHARGGCEIVYRVSDPETVLIVLYRRPAALRRSLSDSFSDISWFMDFLQRRVPEIRFVSALVNVFPYARENGISSRRLTDFCLRCGGELRAVGAREWIHVEVARFVPLRPVRRSVAAAAHGLPSGACG